MHFNPELPITQAVDASSYGLGAVLSHIMPTGEERPIAYASRTLSPAEWNYSMLDKEGLAIVWAVRKFAQYLEGHRFLLWTDHQPLTSLFNPAKGISATAAARIQLWAIYMGGFQYDIRYRKSADNANADFLSRLPVVDSEDIQDNTAEEETEVNVFHMDLMDTILVSAKAVSRATRRDPQYSRIFEAVQKGYWRELPTAFEVRKDELWTQEGCVMWGSRVVIPPKCRQQVLEMLHEGHLGTVKMKGLARSYVWWPGMDIEIESMVKHCDECQQQRSVRVPVPVHPWEYPEHPWERIHMDFAGPLHGKMYLVVVDAHSK